MKVLDESGVKKIVKDYKTADKNINNTLDKVNIHLQKLSNRYNSVGFATYGISNAEGGLIIPIIPGISNCFIIEGTRKPFYAKIFAPEYNAVVRNDGSRDDLLNIAAIARSKNDKEYLIIASANKSQPVVIKPVIDYNNGEYIDYIEDPE
nr:MAG: hypothetical protein [Bacteriophage sp.]